MDIHGLSTEQIYLFGHFIKSPWKSMENSQIPWSPWSPRGIGGGVLSTAISWACSRSKPELRQSYVADGKVLGNALEQIFSC